MYLSDSTSAQAGYAAARDSSRGEKQERTANRLNVELLEGVAELGVVLGSGGPGLDLAADGRLGTAAACVRRCGSARLAHDWPTSAARRAGCGRRKERARGSGTSEGEEGARTDLEGGRLLLELCELCRVKRRVGHGARGSVERGQAATSSLPRPSRARALQRRTLEGRAGTFGDTVALAGTHRDFLPGHSPHRVPCSASTLASAPKHRHSHAPPRPHRPRTGSTRSLATLHLLAPPPARAHPAASTETIRCASNPLVRGPGPPRRTQETRGCRQCQRGGLHRRGQAQQGARGHPQGAPRRRTGPGGALRPLSRSCTAAEDVLEPPCRSLELSLRSNGVQGVIADGWASHFAPEKVDTVCPRRLTLFLRFPVQLITSLHDLASSESDPDLRDLALADVPDAEAALSSSHARLVALLAPAPATSSLGALVELKAGVGGSEASLWSADLVKMYQRLSQRKGWRATLVESVAIEGAGVGEAYKEALLEVTGEGAFGYLRREAGVHRVQRVPATESKGRVHSSTVSVIVRAPLAFSSPCRATDRASFAGPASRVRCRPERRRWRAVRAEGRQGRDDAVARSWRAGASCTARVLQCAACAHGSPHSTSTGQSRPSASPTSRPASPCRCKTRALSTMCAAALIPSSQDSLTDRQATHPHPHRTAQKRIGSCARASSTARSRPTSRRGGRCGGHRSRASTGAKRSGRTTCSRCVAALFSSLAVRAEQRD